MAQSKPHDKTARQPARRASAPGRPVGGVKKTVRRDPENAVYDESGRIYVLGDIIGSGGEGNVHKVSGKNERPMRLMAKVYLPDRAANVDWVKITELISVDWPRKGICHPVSILYDGRRQGGRRPVGFLMAAAEGRTLNATLNVNTLRRIGWSRVELCNLALRVLSMFEGLHGLGIFMADVNPRNIMVDQEDPSKVYFIDVDSYQVGTDADNGYACLVSRQEFLSNRLLGKDFGSGTVFRNMDDELYAITTLLFTIFLPEIFPYARRGVGNLERLNRERRFVFPNGYTDNGEVHRGAESLWYELPRPMREAFYGTFKDGISRQLPEWRILIEEYKEEILDNRKSSAIYPAVDNGRRGPIFREDMPDDMQPETAGHNYRVCQSNGLTMPVVIEFNADGFHVSVPQFGFRNHPDDKLSYRSFDQDMNLWGLLNEKAELDLEGLSRIRLSDSFRSNMRAYTERTWPPVTVIHAIGRSFLRRITNRNDVACELERKMGYSFRYLTAEEEVRMLLADVPLSKGPVLLVSQTAVSLMLALRRPDGSVNIAEITTLGRYTARDWFFTTHIETSKTGPALEEHDSEVHTTIEMRGRGIIKASRASNLSSIVLSGIELPDPGKDSLDCYMARQRTLSNSVGLRDNIKEIQTDLDAAYSEDFREKFLDRLSVPVMTSLLSLLNAGRKDTVYTFFKAPRPSEAYIRYLYS